MDKRLVTFLLVSTVIMVGWLFLTRALMPPEPVAEDAGPEAVEQPQPGDGEDKPDDGDAPPDEIPPKPDEEPGVGGPDEVPAAPKGVERQWITLGSADPNDPYRMLVTLVNTGAAIERIELNSPRFRDLDDLGGYLGHLALTVEEPGPGLRVNVVGAGTPAAQAKCQTKGVPPGLNVGDVLLSAGSVDLLSVADLTRVLELKRPGQSLKLKVARDVDSERQTLNFTVVLIRRPLEIVRPEYDEIDEGGENGEQVRGELHPLSFLMTLEQVGGIDGTGILRNELEIRRLPSLMSDNWEVVPGGPGNADEVAFRLVISDDDLKRVGGRGPIEVIKRFRLSKVPAEEQTNRDFPAYHLEYDLEIRNRGDTPQTLAYRQLGPTGMPLEGWWFSNKIHPKMFKSAGTRDVMFSLTEKPHTGFNLWGCLQIVKQFEKHPDDPETQLYREEKASPLRYAGGDTQYFAAVLMPGTEDAQPGEFVFPEATAFPVGEINLVNKKKTDVSFRLTSEPTSLEAGKSLKRSFVIFAGPKAPKLIEQYDLGDIIVYGWFAWVAIPLLWLLHQFYWMTGEFSYGLAIIMLTVLVRACMFPLSRKQVMSAQKMQELAPEMKKLAEKYKDDMQKKAAAQQELFRKHNYNPLGGCLLVFVQLPIFIGLYRCLSVDVELRQAPLIPGMGWASNLASPDMFWYWKDTIPQFFDFLVGYNGYLGPYLNILPLFTIALFLAQQKMFTPPPTDDQQKMQQQVMTFMMLFIGVLFFRVPSGLCLYFIASSLWGVTERKLLPKVRKPEGPEPVPAREKPPSQAKKARRKKGRHKR